MAGRSRLPLVSVALLVFSVVVILLLAVPVQDVQQAPGFMYGIVLDAGSSHTALFIYRWPADKQNGTGVVTQHAECHVKGNGISSYAGQKGEAGKSLVECLDQAVRDIPKDKHQLTPVYLGATAGMRLLNKSNPQLSDQILKEVGDKIKSYPFKFKGATILSGQDEGAYGWVTVNYLLENFIKYGFVGRWMSPGRTTVGALDLGGASTQITFATQELVEEKRNSMKMLLYGQTYSLYTHSFLCYGINQVYMRMLAHVVKSQGYMQSVTNPCYPADVNSTLKMDDVFGSPCTEEHKPKPYNPDATLTVKGSGNYQQCEENMSNLFSFKDCPYSQCSFNGIFQPNITGNFMAFSTFFYVHSFLQKLTGKPVNSPQQLQEATQTACSMTLSQMSSLVPDMSRYMKNYCTASVFMKTLMLKGYAFDNSTFPQISFQKKAGDTSVGWALGYMLTLSNLLPAERGSLRKALTPGVWGTLIFLFALLLAAALGFLLYQALSKRKDDDEGAI
ncbi:ectonucleoside triphosphate diphosphohydrolase 2 [Oryzias melastigma]|uniref:Ectonucleoside triphosphate diphosphohydrolase 2b n=1 Tax=Oryzias melastigma TaxID=30732 RepID=A0A3B3DM00_ORYME|nr:ectonucleoside triphosphate diphosphohydrolase 2 [Oryzias melastigma]